MKIVAQQNKSKQQIRVQKSKTKPFVQLLKYASVVLVFCALYFIVSYFTTPTQMTISEPIERDFNVLESENGTYFGPTVDMIYAGEGEFQHITGEVYKGNFSSSMREGEGCLYWEDGSKLEGMWSEDKIVDGIYTFPNGITYIGSFSDDKFENGEFSNDIEYENGNYSGEIENSMRGGEGTFTWANGDTYTGVWSADKMIDGKYVFSDGASYTGTFKDNNYQDGVFVLGDNSSERGFKSFSANIKDGEVVGFDFERNDGLTYDGEITGEASITYSSGNIYQGHVVNGGRSGEGTFKWIEASQVTAYYDGQWSDGIMNGSGRYYYSSTAYPYIAGNFVNGKPEGTATYYKEVNNTFKTTWANGYCSNVVES